MSSGIRVAAGCVPIALAQIFAFNEKPATSYFGVTSTWDELKDPNFTYPNNSNATDQRSKDIARIVREIGRGVNARYNLFSSGMTFAFPVDARNHMRRLGYVGVWNRTGYEGHIVETMVLERQQPVFIAAMDNFSGHAWVIDGWLKQEQSMQDYYNGHPIYSPYFSRRDLIHCNFGWGGKCNGYYVPGVFNLTEGPVSTDDVDPNPESDDSNFDWWFRIVDYEY